MERMTTLPPGAKPRLDNRPLTEFQRKVVEAVLSLGPGDVVSYSEIATEVGRPGSAQAVANVLRQVTDLPWWRVVPTGGRLYMSHAPTQRPLLEAEGVRIDADGRVLPAE
jgi:methylated-DNA-protein-cysteine methyltransferase related protein